MAFHIIGDQDTVIGYRFAGATCSAVENADQAREAFRRAQADSETSVLVLTEAVAQMLEQEVLRHRVSAQPPYIVEVSDVWNTNVERKSLEAMIREAVGIRLVRERDEPDADKD